MSSGRLPQELSDNVLEGLRDDKEALKRCSLVSKAWSTTSASLLFERFHWPPCRIEHVATRRLDAANLSCDDIRECEDALAFLVDILEISPRLRSSIRDLHLAHHATNCAHSSSNFAPLLSTYAGALSHLPRLRSVSVLTSWAAPAYGDLAEVHLPLHVYAVEELELSCAFESLPALLSPFRHVSTLSITCPGGPNTDEAHIPQTRDLIEVDSIHVLCWDVPTLSLLRGIVDFQTIRSLKVSNPPSVDEPALGSLIQSMPSLESLRYRCINSFSAPFGTSGCLRLRSLEVGGSLLVLPVVSREEQEDDTEDEDEDSASEDADSEAADADDGADAADGDGSDDDADEDEDGGEAIDVIQGGGLERCEWEYILRDLRILVTAVTEEITIVLNVDEMYTSDDASDPDDVDDIARALRKAFSLLDWDGLHTILRQCPNLRSLRVSLEYEGFIEPEECEAIMRKVLSQHLPEDVMMKTTVGSA